MRVNVYAEEMTERVEIIAKEIDGYAFTGLRLYLELPATVNGVQHQAPFMHRPGDDDSSAVTFWGKRDLRVVLGKMQSALDQHYKPNLAEYAYEKIEACARTAHEANRAYCITIGDTSQLGWDEAPEWQRASARNGVRGVVNGNTPEQSHESWLAEKTATGWKYGPVKDAEKKEHPCFVPYADLPPAQQKKDAIFTGTVRTMALAVGLL